MSLQTDRHDLKRFLSERESELIPLKDGNNWKLRCPVCGDSARRKFMRRGFFLEHEDRIVYKCQNDGCECNTQAVNYSTFMKRYFPDYHSRCRNENLFSRVTKDKFDYNGIVEIKRNPKKDYASFRLLTQESKYQQKAIDYCKKRLIPQSIYETWYVANDGKYKGRMIIPFRGLDGKIQYFQGRTLIGSEPKYLNKVGEKTPYNFEQVDRTKRVFAFEGVIDSLHCENSIALMGLGDNGLIESCIRRFPRLCFVLDDDKAGKTKAKQFLKKGYKVFLWKKFKKHFKLQSQKKWDFNEVVLFMFGQNYVFDIDTMSQFISKSPLEEYLL